MENIENFKPFYFESNACWGFVNTAEDWKNMKTTYFSNDFRTDDKLRIYNARVHKSPKHPNYFGFYTEYAGDETLKDFFLANNMTL